MIIKYVCNCCGEKGINEATLKQIAVDDRILHQCIKCVSAGLTIKDFRAVNEFDVIMSAEYEYLVKETATALRNKDWARKRAADDFKAKYRFSVDERFYFNSDVKERL